MTQPGAKIAFKTFCSYLLVSTNSCFTLIDSNRTRDQFLKPDNIGFECEFHIKRMRTVSEVERTISFDAVLKSRWTDRSLPASLGIDVIAWKIDEYIQLQPSVMDQIWFPKIYFHPLESVEESKENSKLSMDKNGRVNSDMVGRYTFSCPMDLTFFPYDQHSCVVLMETTSGLPIKPKNPFSMARHQSTANFIFHGLDGDIDYDLHEGSIIPGNNHWKHWIRIRMRRKHEVFFTTLFLPNFTLTVLSFVAALTETIFAALSSEMAASRKWKRQSKKLPPASAKDQEVSSASENKNYEKVNTDDAEETQPAPSNSEPEILTEKELPIEQVERQNVVTSRSRVDNMSKMIFPIIFVAWNSAFLTIAGNKAMEASNQGKISFEEMTTILM
ncbi:acetylcholine receptor subunit alpha-type des-2-like [Convolutriloba macropyga]|uniref:acetylcholine receptor subunit alpha-type des-2-like n=1 Tax=Convolutriloba macropyga TaxID=536237 RepID=UPI003F52889D